MQKTSTKRPRQTSTSTTLRTRYHITILTRPSLKHPRLGTKGIFTLVNLVPSLPLTSTTISRGFEERQKETVRWTEVRNPRHERHTGRYRVDRARSRRNIAQTSHSSLHPLPLPRHRKTNPFNTPYLSASSTLKPPHSTPGVSPHKRDNHAHSHPHPPPWRENPRRQSFSIMPTPSPLSHAHPIRILSFPSAAISSARDVNSVIGPTRCACCESNKRGKRGKRKEEEAQPRHRTGCGKTFWRGKEKERRGGGNYHYSGRTEKNKPPHTAGGQGLSNLQPFYLWPLSAAAREGYWDYSESLISGMP